MKDYYQILGISRDATPDEIKKAYRRLAKQYHPDMNKGDKKAEERFKEISEAYGVLSNSEKKKQYDMFGAGAEPGFKGWEKWEGHGFEGVGDIGDIFSELFNLGGVRRRARPTWTWGAEEAPRKGRDAYLNVEIDFTDAIRGTVVKIKVGGGTLSVKIPPGVDNGSRVRVAGKGEEGEGGGEQGDLYLNIRVRPHELFWREGSDTYVEVPISIYEAVLGAGIDVPTLEGHASMKVPAGTESGQKFRLKGKGAPILGKKGVGDQYVVIRIVPPKKLDDLSRKMIEELALHNQYVVR